MSARESAVAEAAKAVLDVFEDGPNTPIRTTWPEGAECWEVPADDLRPKLEALDAAVLAALDTTPQPALGEGERDALAEALEALPCPFRESANAAAWRQGVKAAVRELRILTARE